MKVTVPQGCKSVTLLATARVNDSAGKLIKVKRANLRIRQKGSGGGGY